MEAILEDTACRLPNSSRTPAVLPPAEPPQPDIRAVLTADEVQRIMPLGLSKNPVSLTRDLFFLGEIEQKLSLKRPFPDEHIVMPIKAQEDVLIDDTALAYRSREGLLRPGARAGLHHRYRNTAGDYVWVRPKSQK